MNSKKCSGILSADVAESILDDPDLGEHELRQVIQDELWRIHQKHFKVKQSINTFSPTFSSRIESR